MRTFVKAFLAAVCGIALFIAGLIVWLEITGAGYGIFVKESDDAAASASTTMQSSSATGTGAGSGAGTGTGTSAGAGNTLTSDRSNPELTLIPAPESYGYGSWAENGGNGTGGGNAGGGNNANDGNNNGNNAGGNGNNNGGGNGNNNGGNGGNNAGGNASSVDERTQHMMDFRDQIVRELRAINGENLIVSYDNDTITIAYWDDNLVDRLSRGANIAAIMNMWEQKKEQAQGLSSSYYKRLETYDLDNCHMAVNLLSERDHEQIILSYVDGELKHDGLPEEHLRTQRTDPEPTN